MKLLLVDIFSVLICVFTWSGQNSPPGHQIPTGRQRMRGLLVSRLRRHRVHVAHK